MIFFKGTNTISLASVPGELSQFIKISVKQGAKLLRQLPPHVIVGLPQAPPSSLLAKHLSAEERRRLVASGEAAKRVHEQVNERASE